MVNVQTLLATKASRSQVETLEGMLSRLSGAVTVLEQATVQDDKIAELTAALRRNLRSKMDRAEVLRELEKYQPRVDEEDQIAAATHKAYR